MFLATLADGAFAELDDEAAGNDETGAAFDSVRALPFCVTMIWSPPLSPRLDTGNSGTRESCLVG